MRRRTLLQTGSLAALVGSTPAAAAPPRTGIADSTVHLVGDGVPLTPQQRAQLLVEITQNREIAMDSYSLGGIVTELEQRMAKMLGKEFAIFLPTGTMANHLGVRLLARGRKVIVQKESHLFRDEGDCAQRLSGLNLIPLAAGKAAFAPGEIEEEVEQAEQGRVVVPVGAISIESPVRRRDGEVVPFEQMRQIAEFARKRDIGLHLDGARLYMASAYTGVTPAQYSALFDTVFVSVSKYFNSSFGAVLAGSRKLLEGAFHDRRMLGGGLPHVWTEAAVALHYLDQFEDRYRQAKEAGDSLLSSLGSHKGMEVRRVAPGSNIAFVRTRLKDPQAFVKGMRNAGVAIGAPRSTRQPGVVDLPVTVNETLLRRPVSEIARAFVENA